jgi:hypothetical protein
VDDLVIFAVESGWGKGTFESPSHTGSGRQVANDRDASLANLQRTVMHARVFVLKLPALASCVKDDAIFVVVSKRLMSLSIPSGEERKERRDEVAGSRLS